MIKVLIVDDEENVREALSYIIRKFTTGYNLVDACGNIADCVKMINEVEPDIVLLDIEIGKENAFSLFNHFPKPKFKVIFITGHQQYAIKAFRFAAIDYLLKPIDPDLLENALNKARDLINNEGLSYKLDCLLQNLSTTNRKSKKVVLKTSDKIHVVNLEDVMYCEASRSYTTFYLADKTHILVSNTLGEYEDLFADFDFIRIHQSYLLNINYIKRYDKVEGGKVILKDNTPLPISARKKESFLDALKNI